MLKAPEDDDAGRFLKLLADHGWKMLPGDVAAAHHKHSAGVPNICATHMTKPFWIEVKQLEQTPASHPERTISFDPMTPEQVAFAIECDNEHGANRAITTMKGHVYMLAIVGGPKPVLVVPSSGCFCAYGPCWHSYMTGTFGFGTPMNARPVEFIQISLWEYVANSVRSGFLRWPRNNPALGSYSRRNEDSVNFHKYNDAKEQMTP